MMSMTQRLWLNWQPVSQAMKSSKNFAATFIGEQIDILAKLAHLEGLETVAFILQMAKAEVVDRSTKKGQRERYDQHRAD